MQEINRDVKVVLIFTQLYMKVQQKSVENLRNKISEMLDLGSTNRTILDFNEKLINKLLSKIHGNVSPELSQEVESVCNEYTSILDNSIRITSLVFMVEREFNKWLIENNLYVNNKIQAFNYDLMVNLFPDYVKEIAEKDVTYAHKECEEIKPFIESNTVFLEHKKTIENLFNDVYGKELLFYV